jgi:hypothetical protein
MEQNGLGHSLECSYAALRNAILPMATYATEGKLLGIGIARCTKQLRGVHSIIHPDVTDLDSMLLGECLKSQL